MQHHSGLNFDGHQNAKGTLKSTATDEEGNDHLVFINLTEAKAHMDNLDQVMTLIEGQVEKNDMADLLERALNDMKETLANLTPMMQLADISTVTRAIRENVLTCSCPGQRN